jgi:uncharacterized protein (UPF0548 family)
MVGATADPTPDRYPPGYHQDHFDTDLGDDTGGRFQRASDALRQWAPQRGAGIRIFPGDAVAADLAFVLLLKLPVTGWAMAPGRVAYVVEEGDRFGFAYGTLPGHPERGEEAFLVTRAEGRIRFEVKAFSRPHDLLAQLGSPLARAVQVRTLRTYLRAMEAAAQ